MRTSSLDPRSAYGSLPGMTKNSVVKNVNCYNKIIHAKQVSKILLGERKYIAFAGIGNPEKFFRSVEEAEGILVKKIAFGDHHQYTDKEINNLLELANKHQAMLITTEKDYTRIDEKFKNKIEVLPVVLVWEREEMLMERLLAL